MTEIDVHHDVASGLKVVTLQGPHTANALTVSAVERLHEMIDESHLDGTRAVQFVGTGRVFCAGFDFSDRESLDSADVLWRFVRIELLLQKIDTAPFLTCAVVNGPAIGAGADLACACSFRHVAQGTYLKFPGFGFGLALGTARLARLIGSECAREVLLTGRRLGAAEAERRGMVTSLFEPEAYAQTMESVARDLLSLDRESVSTLLDASRTSDPEAELSALVRSAARPDLVDRLRRFFAER